MSIHKEQKLSKAVEEIMRSGIGFSASTQVQTCSGQDLTGHPKPGLERLGGYRFLRLLYEQLSSGLLSVSQFVTGVSLRRRWWLHT